MREGVGGGGGRGDREMRETESDKASVPSAVVGTNVFMCGAGVAQLHADGSPFIPWSRWAPQLSRLIQGHIQA